MVVGYEILVFLLPFFSLSAAVAQSSGIKVVKDSYVVELNPAVYSAKASRDFSTRRLGGTSTLLIRRGSMGIQSVSPDGIEFIPYDPSDETCQELVSSGVALSCSPDFEFHTLKDSNDSIPWGIEDIGSKTAWNRTTGSDDVVVAVLDTGVDYSHPDLAANMWINRGEIPGNGADDDGNGVIDDIHGMNAMNDSGDPMDDNGHGTHVAGTIGAVGNNGRGVTGVNWKVRIVGLKFLGAGGSGSLSGAIRAMNYLLDLKARGLNVRVVNNSWGGGGFSQQLYDVFNRAASQGILLAVAAGNEGNDNDSNPAYPASFDLTNIISVAATDREHNLASFSNFGVTTVDIAAPGVSILSLAPRNGQVSMSGTSMATPHVAGAVALLWASEPALTLDQVVSRILESGTPQASLSGIVKSGRTLNVGRAVMGESVPMPAPAPELCSYAAEKVAFEPNRSADSTRIVLSGDELEFKKVAFNFDYYGRNAESVYLSLNGLAYVGRGPKDMDYRNGSKAPANAIAALHTDLTAPNSPFGVRYRISADKSVMAASWRMRHFSSPSSGEVRVWLEVHSSGAIKTCAAIDPAILGDVSRSSTIGISPSSSARGTTWAYNETRNDANICVLFTPQCPGTKPGDSTEISVRKVKLLPGTDTESLRPGRRMRINAAGSGTGQLLLSTALNGRNCTSSKKMNMRNGRGRIRGRIPFALAKRRVTRITARVGGRSATKHIYGNSVRRSDKGPDRKLSNAAFGRLCSSLLKSLH